MEAAGRLPVFRLTTERAAAIAAIRPTADPEIMVLALYIAVLPFCSRFWKRFRAVLDGLRRTSRVLALN